MLAFCIKKRLQKFWNCSFKAWKFTDWTLAKLIKAIALVTFFISSGDGLYNKIIADETLLPHQILTNWLESNWIHCISWQRVS